VNVVGSLLIDFLATRGAADTVFFEQADARLFMIVGICGGYTTISSFSLQTLILG
jgi:CrcB protein